MLLFSPGLRSAQPAERKPVLLYIQNGGVHWITQWRLMSVHCKGGAVSTFTHVIAIYPVNGA